MLKESYGLWINGQEVDSVEGRWIEIENPSNKQTISRIAEATAQDVELAVNLAQKTFDDGVWSRKSPKERSRVLFRAAELFRQNFDLFTEVEVKSIGRPIREMKAQIGRLPEWLEYFGSLCQTMEGGVTPFTGDFLNYYRRVPLGVVAQITPWNHPLLIGIKKLCPALACGNSVILKPSELAPLALIDLARILKEAGLPDGVLAVLPGYGHIAGKALIENPLIRKVDFTGGTETGRVVCSLAGSNLASVTAELGGKAAALLFKDVKSLQQAINHILFGAFIASGQTCVAVSRVLVEREIYEEVKEKMRERIEQIKLGDPLDMKTQMGPLISGPQLERVRKMVEKAKEEGGKIEVGGQLMKERDSSFPFDGYYYFPTLISNVTRKSTVFQEEIFGPVVVIVPFDSEEEAIELANDCRFGLGSAIFSSDIKRAHRVSSKLRAGIIWINDYHKNDPSSPWGGMKESGIGRENGIEAFNSYSQTQSVVVSYSEQPFDWFTESGGQRYN